MAKQRRGEPSFINGNLMHVQIISLIVWQVRDICVSCLKDLFKQLFLGRTLQRLLSFTSLCSRPATCSALACQKVRLRMFASQGTFTSLLGLAKDVSRHRFNSFTRGTLDCDTGFLKYLYDIRGERGVHRCVSRFPRAIWSAPWSWL